jgi:hypothetical protein
MARISIVCKACFQWCQYGSVLCLPKGVFRTKSLTFFLKLDSHPRSQNIKVHHEEWLKAAPQ